MLKNLTLRELEEWCVAAGEADGRQPSISTSSECQPACTLLLLLVVGASAVRAYAPMQETILWLGVTIQILPHWQAQELRCCSLALCKRNVQL